MVSAILVAAVAPSERDRRIGVITCYLQYTIDPYKRAEFQT
jgi:hypothetical protein